MNIFAKLAAAAVVVVAVGAWASGSSSRLISTCRRSAGPECITLSVCRTQLDS